MFAPKHALNYILTLRAAVNHGGDRLAPEE
jgi:hypothetical protein